MTTLSEIAATSYFSCETVEEVNAFPKVCIVSKVQIDKGEIKHINTNVIKAAIEDAVKLSVEYLPDKHDAK